VEVATAFSVLRNHNAVLSCDSGVNWAVDVLANLSRLIVVELKLSVKLLYGFSFVLEACSCHLLTLVGSVQYLLIG